MYDYESCDEDYLKYPERIMQCDSIWDSKIDNRVDLVTGLETTYEQLFSLDEKWNLLIDSAVSGRY
jgi:hypothetical protein